MAVIDLDLAACAAVAAECGNGARAYALNVADGDAIARVVAQIAADFGGIDILVNNLGIFEPKAFEDIPDADWTRFFDVNVLSGVRLSRQVLPGMKRRNWGRILFISSESGIQIPAEMIHYGMTKTAQLSVSHGFAMELAGTGVTVNALLPGPTHTETTDRLRAERAGTAPARCCRSTRTPAWRVVGRRRSR